jgi:hypothetical protein
MTVAEARQRVLDHVNPGLKAFDDEAAIFDASTITKPYGWIFFYQSKRYLETGVASHALAGNGPVVVLSRDRSVHPLGTGAPTDDTIAAFERRAGLEHRMG